MQTRRFIGLLPLAAALALAGCTGSGDKAGGSDAVKPRVLTMAVQSGVQEQLAVFANEVSRLSDGALEIAFQDKWRLGEPTYEAGTLEDVKAGKVDMAWVGARTFDTVGVTSFEALLAPLLVDSYDLEAAVFEQGIPDEMLKGVDELDLVGIGVLPGPMRKLLGVSQPFVVPDDFAGRVVGIQDSAVAAKTLDALGATPKPVPAEAELDGLDAYEQQLSSIAGNSYDATAKYVTSNVNLWPRPLVIVMSAQAHDSLTDEQQAALRDAAAAAIPKALEVSRVEDEEAAATLCRRGMTFSTASAADLNGLRSALGPVYAELGSDAATRAYMDAIISLKTKIAAPAEAPGCIASGSVRAASAGIPEGIYETSVTRKDYARWGVELEGTGVFTLELKDGVMILRDPSGQVGFEAPYTLFRDRFEAVGEPDTLTARWTYDGTRLEFEDFGACSTGSPCVPLDERNYHVVWASHPWVRVDAKRTPIDGVYEFTTALSDFSEPTEIENYGRFRFVLDGGRYEMTQRNGASDRWTKGTYVVRDGVLEFTVEEFGGVAPNDAHERTGEVFTYRWSLYRDRLRLEEVEGKISPVLFRAKPWRRVADTQSR